MKHIPKQSWFKSLAVSLCLIGCVSLGLKKGAANAISANSVVRDEVSADLPQNQKPQPFSISGKVARANGTGVAGVTITFLRNIGSGSLPGSVVTSLDGHWTQSGFETLTSYVVNLSRPGFTFQPAAATFSGARSDFNFEGTTDPFSFSGKVTTSFKNLDSGSSPEVGVSGTTISFARVSGPGRVPRAVTTDSSGHWTQSGFEGDTVYRASPNKQGFDFNPTSAEFRNVKPSGDLDFEGHANTLTGTVKALEGGIGIAGVTMNFSVVSGHGSLPRAAVTDSQGKWSQSGFDNDTTYEVTPSREGFAFSPGGSRINLANGQRTNLVFDGLKILFNAMGRVVLFNDTLPPSSRVPVPGVTVVFSLPREPNETPPRPVVTDANGIWRQTGFKKGKTYGVYINKPPGFSISEISGPIPFTDDPGEIVFCLSRL